LYRIEKGDVIFHKQKKKLGIVLSIKPDVIEVQFFDKRAGHTLNGKLPEGGGWFVDPEYRDGFIKISKKILLNKINDGKLDVF